MTMPTTSQNRHIVCPWVTPKAFPDLDRPEGRVCEFFDHYAPWFDHADLIVVNFCTGNGDHILNYRGRHGDNDSFDWARYNCYGGLGSDTFSHNLHWLKRVRDGGEEKGSPYIAGPFFMLSDQAMTYRRLRGIYAAFREEAARRALPFRILEYLEPGPEFCRSEWKTRRHPEAAQGPTLAGAPSSEKSLDVCSQVHGDRSAYAAYPAGFEAGLNTGEFVAAQASAFTRDLEVDGVFLGNQFGLTGFWDPKNAPDPTPARREGISRFFRTLREAMGKRLIYWMDTYWPVEVEVEAWAMDPHNYAQLDAVMCSNFAVIVNTEQMVPNLISKLRLRSRLGKPDVLFSLDFVDPWYWYRVYQDEGLREVFAFQHQTYRAHGAQCQGVSFFAHDTFGHWVPFQPLQLALAAITEAHGWKAGA